jgi:hypothetical protein
MIGLETGFCPFSFSNRLGLWRVRLRKAIEGRTMAGENAAKRLRLFDLFVSQPGHADITHGKYFFCPLCREPFNREDCVGENPKLTLAHIVPDSQGGTWKTLSCAGCNNNNGREIEKDFLTQQKLSDWVYGRGAIPIRLGEGGKIKGEMTRDPVNNRTHIKILTSEKNRAVAAYKEQVMATKRGDEFKVTTPWFRNGWNKATICQSAYLLMFRSFGYDFARCETYELVLRQIRDPHQDHNDVLTAVVPPDVAAELLEGKQAGVYFVSEPVKCILAVMRFTSPGKAGLFEAVVMPGPGEPPLTEFTMSGMRFTPVEDNVEVSGHWGLPLVDEWRHWQQTAATA